MVLSGLVMNCKGMKNKLELNINETGAFVMFKNSLILTLAAIKINPSFPLLIL